MAVAASILSPTADSFTTLLMRRPVLLLFIAAQTILIGIELFTRYDTAVRQGALIVTALVTGVAVMVFDRWLVKRGMRLSWITFLLVAGSVWLDALGNFQHLYGGFWWWDRLTHTVGGMALSAAFIDLFLAFRRNGRLPVGWSWAAWMGVLVGQLLGSIYEISEWLGDYWFHTQRVTGVYDAPHDLFQNLVGGLVVLGLMWLFRRRSQVG